MEHLEWPITSSPPSALFYPLFFFLMTLMRITIYANSVIVVINFKVIANGFLANSLILCGVCGENSKKCAVGGCILLMANASLILVDNVHFQYNGILTAILLFSLAFAIRGQLLVVSIIIVAHVLLLVFISYPAIKRARNAKSAARYSHYCYQWT